MIVLDVGEKRFSYRAAGIFIKDGSVLLHRADVDDYWTIPGGRVELGEAAVEAVERELKEELGIGLKVITPAFVADNFFELNDILCHELGIYFWVQADETSYIYKSAEFPGVEPGSRLIFKWFALAEVDQLEVYPLFLRQRLQSCRRELEYISNREHSER